MRYTDPTGHTPACNPMEDDCHNVPAPTPVYNPGPPGNPHDDDVPDDDGIILPVIPGQCPLGQTCYLNNPPFSYCGGGANGWYNSFDCLTNVTQDFALVIDIPFAGVELAFIAAGCFYGGWVGCAGGAKVGIVFFNVTGANSAETILSAASAGFSVAADIADGGVLSVGESTATALSGLVAGSLSIDPIADTIIDAYRSGYDHDVFNGVYSFFTDDPFLR